MKTSAIPELFLKRVIGAVVVFTACLPLSAWSQNDSDVPLAELARKTQAEKKSKDHVTARKILNEENVAKPGWRKWSDGFNATYPPASLTITVPREWPVSSRDNIQSAVEKSGVYIGFGNTDWSGTPLEDVRQNLQNLFASSIFYGSSVKLRQMEDTSVDGQGALLVHFEFMFRSVPHSGLALFVSAPQQVMSVGCMYRDLDRDKASLICEQVMSSAEAKVPTEYRVIKSQFRR